MNFNKQTKTNKVDNPFGVAQTTLGAGIETPQFNSQQSELKAEQQNRQSSMSNQKQGKVSKASAQCAPTSSASFLLELQHSQITEVNSEYEVTQNDRNGRPSITPQQRGCLESQQTFSFNQSVTKTDRSSKCTMEGADVRGPNLGDEEAMNFEGYGQEYGDENPGEQLRHHQQQAWASQQSYGAEMQMDPTSYGPEDEGDFANEQQDYEEYLIKQEEQQRQASLKEQFSRLHQPQKEDHVGAIYASRRHKRLQPSFEEEENKEDMQSQQQKRSHYQNKRAYKGIYESSEDEQPKFYSAPDHLHLHPQAKVSHKDQRKGHTQIDQRTKVSTLGTQGGTQSSQEGTQLQGFSIGDLFAQIMKRTGLDEQREQTRLHAQEIHEYLDILKAKVQEQIDILDQRCKHHQETLAMDQSIHQSFTRMFKDPSHRLDIVGAPKRISIKELEKMLSASLESFEDQPAKRHHKNQRHLTQKNQMDAQMYEQYYDE